MAEVYVDSWFDYEENGVTKIGLASGITGVTSENTDIYITDDIDLKSETEHGKVTTSVTKPSNSYIATVHGNGCKISNLWCDTNIRVIDGQNTNRLIFDDVIFEDWLIENGCAFSALTINNSEISMTLVDRPFVYVSSVKINNSGITVTGAGTGLASFDFGNNDYKADGCNIQLFGKFQEVTVCLRNSYLGGEFQQIGTSSSQGFGFASSFCSMIDADIICDKAPVNPNSLTLLVVNSDKFVLPSGSSWADSTRNKYTVVPDSDINNPSVLKSFGFPAR